MKYLSVIVSALMCLWVMPVAAATVECGKVHLKTNWPAPSQWTVSGIIEGQQKKCDLAKSDVLPKDSCIYRTTEASRINYDGYLKLNGGGEVDFYGKKAKACLYSKQDSTDFTAIVYIAIPPTGNKP